MNDLLFLDAKEFEIRTRAALNWLKRSFDVNAQKGSSAYYSQLWRPFGWSLAYPETTGYIIETLYDYSGYYPDMQLDVYATNAADWICDLQLPGGALPGGLANSKNPSVFNTGQMIFGLIRAYEHTSDKKYFEVFRSAVHWLVNNLKPDGTWDIGAYVAGYMPSYYTRVIWPILWANQYINDTAINDKMHLALNFYQSKLTSKYAVKDWSFKSGQKAFTHTIAYTIRGFYESSLITNDEKLNNFAIKLADKIMHLRELNGRLAGWYSESWQGDYWFCCLTGNCQMAIILNRIYEQTSDPRYLNTALKLFGDVISKQHLGSNINKKGAIPGSAPFHGRYMALRYPNWATKFFLDAYRLLDKNVQLVIRENETGSTLRV